MIRRTAPAATALLAVGALLAGCGGQQSATPPPEDHPPPSASGDGDADGTDADLEGEGDDADEDDGGGLERGSATGGTSLELGGGVEAPPLERRAIELFSDLGATDTDVGALVEVPDDVLFDFDDDQLKPGADEVLAELTELAELTGKVPIRVVGHTDGRGSDDHNLDLSHRRADAVAGALEDAGVDPARIEATGVGPSEPVAEEGGADDDEARARNRRVAVTFEGVDLDG